VTVLEEIEHPIVLAPLAGGPSTPELTAAVADAGAFAFLAAGYLSPTALAEQLEAVRRKTNRDIGVNLFVPGQPADPRPVDDYASLLAREAERLGVSLCDPRFDDDGWRAKLDVLLAEPVAAVSFTFGCPPAQVIDGLHRRGSEVWVTATTPREAVVAETAGADVVVAQGIEAGGHRGSWIDDPSASPGLGLLALVQLVRAQSTVPIVATGGIATGRGIAAIRTAGANAAALGTAFLLCPEAGTSAVHRKALSGSTSTALTRAFTGRLARGIRNRMLEEYGPASPSAYPEIHYLTAPLRRAGRDAQEGDVVNMWAGEAYHLARELPAAEVVANLVTELAASMPRLA
jgi:nitronate monooxygenase